MKIKILIILVLLLNTEFSFAENWTKKDTYTELAFLSIHFLDYQTTIDIAKKPNLYVEKNIILGEHPSIGRVNTYFISTAIIHPIISYYLPKKYRKTFQYFSIGVSTLAVTNNLSCGLKFQF